MDFINIELELFFMKDGETGREIYDRLMSLSRTLGLLEVNIGMTPKSQRSS
jgi:hypothetical protein